jgi:hypothetical protein
LLAAYGVDVLDPAVSTRRVHVLLAQLPPSARRGAQRWSTEAELLAGVIDHLAMLTYVTLKANGAKSAKKPVPVPRPPVARPYEPAGDGRKRPVDSGHAPGGKPGSAPVRASSWADAARALAGVPGVKVSTDASSLRAP